MTSSSTITKILRILAAVIFILGWVGGLVTFGTQSGLSIGMGILSALAVWLAAFAGGSVLLAMAEALSYLREIRAELAAIRAGQGAGTAPGCAYDTPPRLCQRCGAPLKASENGPLCRKCQNGKWREQKQ